MRFTYKAVLLAAAASIATPAFAQDDELVVTATRLASPVERLPADVDVIDADAAQNRGITNIADALADVPGLGVARSGGFGQQTSLFSGGANSNHTLVLFDGLQLNDPSTPGSSFDGGQDTLAGLDRIEIVQGPMGAVFGSDAIGGVINILPRRGHDGPMQARLDIGGGSFGTLNASAGIDGSYGALRYALTAEGYVTDGYDLVPERMSTRTGHADGAESSTFTGVFDIDVTEALTLDLLVRHRQARADFDAFIYPPPTFNEQRADDADLDIAQNDLSVARVGLTWRLNDVLELRATTGALRQDRREEDGGASTSSYEGQRDFGDVTLQWRPRNLGAFANVGVIAGHETQSEEVDIDQGFATVIAEQEHQGAFVTAQGDINRVTLTGAVRVDDYEGFGEEMTWRAGASFDVLGNVRVYGAYGTSFRAPTLYERFIYFGDPNLAPERGEAWEVGGDARFRAFASEDGLEFGLVYRRQEITDLIDFGPFFTYVNIDAADIESAEATLTVRPLAWLSGRIVYTHTEATDATTGAALLRRPENTWHVSVDATRGALTGQIGWRHIGERADQIYGNDGFYRGVGVTPAYELFRASLAWAASENVQLYVASDNLADVEYEPVNGFAGAPQTLSVGIRLRR
jgi:vitamin B12 transporter